MAKRARMREPAAVGASRSRRVCAAWSRRPRSLRRGRGYRRGVVRLGLRRIKGAGLLKSGLAIARGCLLNGCTARGAELGIIFKKLAARGAIPRHCHSFRHISMQYDDYTQHPKFPIIRCGEIGTVWRSQSFNQSLFHRNFGKAPLAIGDVPSTGVSWLGCYNSHLRAL